MLVKKNNYIKKITASCFVLLLAVFLFCPMITQAQTAQSDINESLARVAEQTPLQNADPRLIVGRIIKVALSLIGTVAIGLVIYAGFLYMTSGGDKEKTGKARAWLINAAIGLVIIFSAYAITSFIFRAITGATQQGVQIAGGLQTGYQLSGGAFGTVIQSHYPAPEQRDVPRNTMILVTFRVPIDPGTVIDEGNTEDCPEDFDGVCGAIKDSFKVFRCDAMPDFSGKNASDCLDAKIDDPEDADNWISGYGLVTEDHKTVIFNPYANEDEHLGSATENVSYIVYLNSGIERDGESGKSIFTIAHQDYKWRFTTGTIIDTTPPQISSIVPADKVYPVPAADRRGCNCSASNPQGCNAVDCDGKVYLNQIIVINFNEPVIPPIQQSQNCNAGDNTHHVQVLVSDESAAPVAGCSTLHVSGKWQVGVNAYRTIQFTSNTPCEGVNINSCGQPVFCLPPEAKISNKLYAAKVLSGVSSVGSGITDLAGNSLDGNANGQMDGQGDPPEKDNFYWDFATGNSLDLDPPFITLLEPANASPNQPPNILINATFNEGLSPDSVDSNVAIYGENFSGWYDPNMGVTMVDNKPEVDLKKISISHAPFARQVEGESAPLFRPVITSQVKDLRQNCFSPTKDAVSECNVINTPGFSCCPDAATNELKEVNSETCGY